MAWKLSAGGKDGVIYQSDKWVCDDGDYASVEIHHLPHNDVEIFVNCFGGVEVSHVVISTKELPMMYYMRGKELDYWKKDVKTRERWACRVADDICRRFCREERVNPLA